MNWRRRMGRCLDGQRWEVGIRRGAGAIVESVYFGSNVMINSKRAICCPLNLLSPSAAIITHSVDCHYRLIDGRPFPITKVSHTCFVSLHVIR